MLQLQLTIMFILALCVAGCASSNQTMGFEEARAMFAARGVQLGQPLPTLSLVTLDGQPASIQSIQGDRPLVLITASLTCNVARRQQEDVNALREQFGDRIAVVVVYTIDAHPKGDPCPYTHKEWVPEANIKDNVLMPQPVTLDDRVKLAREYSERYCHGTTVLVDTMDNASWIALGEAPNLGLLIDRDGIVRLRQGWFEMKEMEAAIRPLVTGARVQPAAGREPM
jgi:peroxiredoxin